MKSYLRLIIYLNMKENWGYLSILKSYNEFCIGMFLHMYVMYYKSSHARMRILTDAHSVINGQKKVNKVSKCLNKCAKYDDRENLAILRCKMRVRAKTRTHGRARVFFAKCLKWP